MKKFLSLLLATLMMLSASIIGVFAEDTLPFTDVPADEWYTTAVEYVYGKGLMNGTGNGSTFAPTMNLTRGMVVTVLYRNDGSPAVETSNPFADVADGQYYATAAAWAYDEGVVTGTGTDDWGDPLFSPNRNITRQELATMFARYAAYKYVDTTKNTTDITSFPDSGKVASWAADSFKWSAGTGIITGKTSGGAATLAPEDLATRAEFAIMIQRYNTKDDAREFTYHLAYARPVAQSTYNEPEYTLVNDADLYVATDGNDNNEGSFDKPLATLEGARQAVRKLKESGKTGEIVVAFKAGDYGITTVSFDEADSGSEDAPVTYCAYGDGEVYFTNGVFIEKDKFVPIDASDDLSRFSDEAEGSIKKVSLSDLPGGEKVTTSSQVFSDGVFCNIARYPNKNGMADAYLLGFTKCVVHDDSPYTIEEVIEAGEIGTMTTTEMDTYICQDRLVTTYRLKEKLMSYSSLKDVQLVGYISKVWYQDVFTILSFDETTGLVIYDGRPPWGYYAMAGGQTKVYINNVSEELDCNGEYWIDHNTKTLYVYAPSDNYYIATDGTFLKGSYADNLSFVNLNFRCNTDSPFRFDRCDNITVDRCNISYTNGNDGIVFKECLGVNFINNEVAYTSGYGIFVDGPGIGKRGDAGYDYMALMSQEIVIDNNLFHHVSLVDIHSDVAAIKLSGNVIGATISHNEVYNASRHAISFGQTSFDVLIEYNYFYKCMTNSADGGVIHNGRGVVGPKNVIRYNIFNDIVAALDGGTYGVYMDDFESDTEVYSNIFYNVSTPIVTNGGRDNYIHDNVSILAGNFFIKYDFERATNTWLGEDSNSEFQYQFNELLPKPGSKYYDIWFEKCPSNYALELDAENMYNRNSAFVQNNTVVDNLFYDCDDIVFEGDIAKVSTFENNREMSTDENVCFADPTHGDYSVTNTSVIADNHFAKIGRY